LTADFHLIHSIFKNSLARTPIGISVCIEGRFLPPYQNPESMSEIWGGGQNRKFLAVDVHGFVRAAYAAL
jgi:hypothetical protein